MFCVSVALSGLENIKKAIQGTEMAEVRLEQSDLSINEIKELFSLHKNLIATCRPTDKITTNQRKNILKSAINNGASWVDIEIESEEVFISEILEEAKKNGCKVIISYHNYSETPQVKELLNILEKAKKYNTDLIKIACKVNSKKDNSVLLSLYETKLPILAIGIGVLGIETRVKALRLGSPFTFVKGENTPQTADGQITAKELCKML